MSARKFSRFYLNFRLCITVAMSMDLSQDWAPCGGFREVAMRQTRQNLARRRMLLVPDGSRVTRVRGRGSPPDATTRSGARIDAEVDPIIPECPSNHAIKGKRSIWFVRGPVFS